MFDGDAERIDAGFGLLYLDGKRDGGRFQGTEHRRRVHPLAMPSLMVPGSISVTLAAASHAHHDYADEWRLIFPGFGIGGVLTLTIA